MEDPSSNYCTVTVCIVQFAYRFGPYSVKVVHDISNHAHVTAQLI